MQSVKTAAQISNGYFLSMLKYSVSFISDVHATEVGLKESTKKFLHSNQFGSNWAGKTLRSILEKLRKVFKYHLLSYFNFYGTTVTLEIFRISSEFCIFMVDANGNIQLNLSNSHLCIYKQLRKIF